MDDLIKALLIFKEYYNCPWPTRCDHDILYIVGIHKANVSEYDHAELEKLGFYWDDRIEQYYSTKYGSA